MNYTNKSYLLLGCGFLAALAVLYQNFLLFGPDYRLSAFPNICHAGQQTTCEVEVEWKAGVGKSGCLFRASNKSLIACAAKKRISVRTGLTGDVLQLRSGPEFGSPLIEQIRVAAIQVQERVLKQDFVGAPQLTEPLVKGVTGFAASTWDGQIFFSAKSMTVSSGATRQYFEARVLRPQEFAGKNPVEVDFKKAFSAPYMLNIDPLAESDQAEILSRLRGKILGLDKVEANEGNTYGKAHMTIAPDPSFHENPYRSDRFGKKDDEGLYRTYRFQVISAVRRLVEEGRTIQSEYYREFLAHAKGQLTVENTGGKTQIVDGEIGAFSAMRDPDDQLFAGHEATVTLDGRLLVWDGQPTIRRDGKSYRLKGFNNMLMYSYRPDPRRFSGWSKPRALSEMYFTDGPGRGSEETRIDNVKFSQHFPLAKYPIVDDLGVPFGANQPISGSYPWISLDGADVVYSSVFTYTGNQRRGTVVLGAHTRGKIRHVDGGMNVFRGVSPFEQPILSQQQRNELHKAYAALPLPTFANAVIGEGAQWNILFSHLVEFPTSWDGLRDVLNPGFPISFADEAYGFFVSPSSRYAEVPLPSVAEDLLLWLPMNESIRYSRTATEEYIKNPSVLARQAVTGYRTKSAPDMSIYHHRGALSANAFFPYEYYDAANQWVKNRKLTDRYEGAQGNSVILAREGQVSVTLSQKALGVLNDIKRYHASFWIRPHEVKATPLFTWNRVLSVALNNSGKLIITHTLKNSTESEFRQTLNFEGKAKEWKHLLIQRDLDRVNVYINGRFQTSIQLAENSFPNWLTFPHSGVVVGPSALSRLDVDEVRIGTGYLTEREIRQLARVKVRDREWPASAKDLTRGNYFLSRDVMARIPEDNPFTLKAAAVGELLFNEKSLSSNGKVSCASCHLQKLGFADSRSFSMGVGGPTGRNSPALINLAFMDSFFWDGSAKTLESQVLHPFLHPDEMGLSLSGLRTRVEAVKTIKDKMVEVYGGPVSPTNIAKALASYVRARTTPTFNFNPQSLTGIEQRGWNIFNGRGNCVGCHSGALFSDGKLHDIGLDPTGSPGGFSDLGAFRVRKDSRDLFAFKTPSLINVEATAPYFHDGRMNSLEEVIEFYDRGGDASSLGRSGRSPFLRPLGLTAADKEALAAFLRSLSAPVN